jgi:transcriptional regulator with XRE-family HTH domain
MGAYLRERRLAAGLPQQWLADLIGSTQPAIARLEAGGVAIGMSSLARIADALGCELEVTLVDRTTALRSGVPVQFAPQLHVPVSKKPRLPEQDDGISSPDDPPQRFHYCESCEAIGPGPICAQCGQHRRQSFKTEDGARKAGLKARLAASEENRLAGPRFRRAPWEPSHTIDPR